MKYYSLHYSLARILLFLLVQDDQNDQTKLDIKISSYIRYSRLITFIIRSNKY